MKSVSQRLRLFYKFLIICRLNKVKWKGNNRFKKFMIHWSKCRRVVTPLQTWWQGISKCSSRYMLRLSAKVNVSSIILLKHSSWTRRWLSLKNRIWKIEYFYLEPRNQINSSIRTQELMRKFLKMLQIQWIYPCKIKLINKVSSMKTKVIIWS